MSRLRFPRFQHLERRRQPGAETPAPADGPDRFDVLEPAYPPAAPAPAEPSTLERFRRQESGLELDRAGDAQPFRRCCRCGADAQRAALACATCGADLRTPEQDAFNARLWEAHRREALAEAAREAARREAARVAAEEDAVRRRALAEQLAAEVGRQERARLEREGFAGAGPRDGPLAERLLRALESQPLRLAVGLGGAALLALLLVFALATGRVGLALLVLAVGLVLLVPPRLLVGRGGRGHW